jgi:hypothetical protein
MKMGTIPCPETSVKDYHSTLRYTPEEPRSQARLKSSDHSIQSNILGCIVSRYFILQYVVVVFVVDQQDIVIVTKIWKQYSALCWTEYCGFDYRQCTV